MPVYYFHLNAGRRRIIDTDGFEFADDAAALDHATQVVQELTQNSAARNLHWWFEVCDGKGVVHFELLFASVGTSLQGAPAETRALIERCCEQFKALIEAMDDARATISESRALLARAHVGTRLRSLPLGEHSKAS